VLECTSAYAHDKTDTVDPLHRHRTVFVSDGIAGMQVHDESDTWRLSQMMGKIYKPKLVFKINLSSFKINPSSFVRCCLVLTVAHRVTSVLMCLSYPLPAQDAEKASHAGLTKFTQRCV
jgi:hypothetical protein